MNKEAFVEQLKADLKEKGLPLAEDAIEIILEVLEKNLAKIIQESENKFDDLALPFLPTIFNFAKAQVDKIDGKVEDEKKD